MKALLTALLLLALACSNEDESGAPEVDAGSGGLGGSAGSGASGGAPGGAGGAGATSGAGGQGGAPDAAQPDGGGGADGGGRGGMPDASDAAIVPEGGSDAGELCAERSGGALITFQVVDETLTVWVTDDAFIDEAIRLRDAGEQRIPVFDTLIDGQDCDAQWTFHPDPESVSFADFTIELCDGIPSHIEGDKTYWIDTVGSYCPWSAQVVAVDDRR